MDSEEQVHGNTLNRQIKRKMKKEIKKQKEIEKKKAVCDVHFHLSHGMKPLSFNAVPELLTWILGPSDVSPSWCFVKNKSNISRVLLVFLPGLDSSTFFSNQHLFPCLTKLCSKPLVTKCSSTSPVDALGSVHSLLTCEWKKEELEPHIAMRATLTGLHDSRKRRRADEERAEEAQVEGRERKPPQTKILSPSSPLPVSHYLLSEEQMKRGGFPWLDDAGHVPDGHVQTCSSEAALDMAAVDCEMCRTAAGLELTRLTVVDPEGKVLYDTHVVPPNPITDYLTKYSGITEETLRGVTTTLQEVQSRFMSLVSEQTVLVGHSLANDLRALRVLHARVLDTASLFPHPRGPPYSASLKVLAQRFLGRSIQTSETDGHDSAEDAQAAMDLALLKLKRGPSFGLSWSRVSRCSVIGLLSQAGNSCTLIDTPEIVKAFDSRTSSAIQCFSDAQVMDRLCRQARSGTDNFVWARLTSLHSLNEACSSDQAHVSARSAQLAALSTARPKRKGPIGSEGPALPPSAPVAEAMKAADSRVGLIHDSLQPGSLLLVATGYGDVHLVSRLQSLAWQQDGRRGAEGCEGDAEEAAVLEAHKSAVHHGLLFASVKNCSPD